MPPPSSSIERADPIRWWGTVAPDREALSDRTHGGRWTYRELDRLCDAWAARLVARGVTPGDRVATLAGNNAAHVALLFACGRVGAILVPLNWRLAAPELRRIVENARPRLIVGEARFRALAEAGGGVAVGARWEEIGGALDAPLGAYALTAAPHTHASDAPAMILYTSGSTGMPKGAVLPHRQLFYNAVATLTGWELGPADVAPVATPFFHTGGWNVFATPLWFAGGRVVLFDQFDPAAFLEGIADEHCTVALAVPTQLVMMLECAAWGDGTPLPALRFFISGGAPCPPSTIARVRDAGHAMKEGYGLTECGPNCFAISLDEALQRPASVGWPSPFLSTRVIRDDGSEAEPGEVGELLLRGPQRFDGYFDDPVRTAEAVDRDGWLHTGDLAVRDEDGAHRICGRRKEMFISGGENVYPGEVEAALAAHPAVSEVAVVGVTDAKWGEVGRAFVVLRAGTHEDDEALLSFVRLHLAGYKVPKSLHVVDALPRLGAGKVDRAALAAVVSGQSP